MQPCSHVWIDPDDPPMQRSPYAPWVGPRRREMKHGHPYRCLKCFAILIAPPRTIPPAARLTAPAQD